MQKTRTTVRIAGREYTLTGYDGEEYVRRVAQYVDRKITELELATRLPSQQLAVLTSVSIADELHKAQDDNARLRKELMQAREELETLRGARNED